MARNRTSIKVDPAVRDRLHEKKPFASMSHGEFIEFLLDQYEPEGATAPGGVDA